MITDSKLKGTSTTVSQIKPKAPKPQVLAKSSNLVRCILDWLIPIKFIHFNPLIHGSFSTSITSHLKR